MKMAKQKDPRFFLLQTVPGVTDKVITGSRLPTTRQVLLSFLAHKEDLAKNGVSGILRTAANETATQVVQFYQKARVPMITTTRWQMKFSNFILNSKTSENSKERPR
jgi:hypothetical protein